MDGPRFDDLARSLAGTPTRRGLGRAALAAVAGALGQPALRSAAAGKCTNDGDCDGCQTCNRRKGRCRDGCGKGKRCCGEACVDPRLCCDGPEDCNACAACVDGRCRPDTAKNGQACGDADGCLVCANGTCGIPSDGRCGSDERCRATTGTCCARCLRGRCCPDGLACINPGLLSRNSCCDTRANEPCGDNGDGTFAQCCSNRNEVCDGGTCKPKDECPGGLTAQGVCCADPDKLCENESRCCGEFEICNDDDACGHRVCPRASCANLGKRCPPNGFFADAYCCEQHQTCVGGSVGCAEPPQ